MARIPSQVLVQPRYEGVEMPRGAFAPMARATTNLFQAIGGSVETAKQFMDQAQEIRNDQDVRDKTREMRTMQAKFLEEITQNQADPATWTTEWEKRLATFEGELAKNPGKYPPNVLTATTEHFKDFAGQSLISISASALKENRRRAKGSLMLDHDFLLENQQFDAAQNLLQEGVEKNILDPLEHKEASYKTEAKREAADIQLAMLDNPDKLVEDIRKGDYDGRLSDLQKMETIVDAKRFKANNERNATQTVRDSIENGFIKTKEELVAELENWPELSANTRKAIIANYDNIKPLESSEKFEIADSLKDAARMFIDGEISEAEYGTIHDQVQTRVLTIGGRQGAGALKSMLHNYDPVTMAGSDVDDMRKQFKKRFESSDELAKDIIRERANGATNIAVAKLRDSLGEESNSTGLASLRTERAEYGLLFRSEMEVEFAKWQAARAAKGDANPPDSAEVTEAINKFQPEVVERLERRLRQEAAESKNKDTAASPPRALPVLDRTEAQKKVDEWLSNTDGDLVLPPRNQTR